jgi:hypothetical protein
VDRVCRYRTRLEANNDLVAWCWCETKSGRHTLLTWAVVLETKALTLRKIGTDLREPIGGVKREYQDRLKSYLHSPSTPDLDPVNPSSLVGVTKRCRVHGATRGTRRVLTRGPSTRQAPISAGIHRRSNRTVAAPSQPPPHPVSPSSTLDFPPTFRSAFGTTFVVLESYFFLVVDSHGLGWSPQ